MKKILFLFLLFFTVYANAKSTPASTIWQAQFLIDDSNRLPVTFAVEGKQVYVLNADEKIALSELTCKKDSVFIRFKAFDSEIKVRVINSKHVEGAWYNYAKGNDYAIPFVGSTTVTNRFPINPSDIDVFGRWEVTFDYDKTPEKALGIFEAKTNESEHLVKGTFLTETGDYRYLDGVVSSDSLLLSTFDGSHAFLFKSKLVNDTLWGTFLSGTHYQSNWYAVRNTYFELTNPDSLTYLVSNEPIAFELNDLNQQPYRYPNANLKNKVTLIQIMGTWCPNCLDESNYLKTQKEKYGNDLEILTVTFEMPENELDQIKKVKAYKENLGLDFTFLIGGKASKTAAADLFPMLNHVMSFPTLIFIDRKGEIRRIHTGFNGPGTGVYYTRFVTETDSLIKMLVTEV